MHLEATPPPSGPGPLRDGPTTSPPLGLCLEGLPSSPSLPLSHCPEQTPNVSWFPLEKSWEVCLQLQPTPPICAGSAGRAETQALEFAGIQGTAALPGLRSPHNWPPESECMLLQSPVPVPVCTRVHRSNPEHASSGTQSPPRKDATHMCRRRPQTRRKHALIQHAHAGMQSFRCDALRPPQSPPSQAGHTCFQLPRQPRHSTGLPSP